MGPKTHLVSTGLTLSEILPRFIHRCFGLLGFRSNCWAPTAQLESTRSAGSSKCWWLIGPRVQRVDIPRPDAAVDVAFFSPHKLLGPDRKRLGSQSWTKLNELKLELSQNLKHYSCIKLCHFVSFWALSLLPFLTQPWVHQVVQDRWGCLWQRRGRRVVEPHGTLIASSRSVSGCCAMQYLLIPVVVWFSSLILEAISFSWERGPNISSLP